MKSIILLSAAAILVSTSNVRGQDFDAVQINIHPVAGNVSFLTGRGGNIGLFIGEDGVFLIDDQYAPLTDKIVAAIRTQTDAPIRFLVNTHLHHDHTGGNENFGRMGTTIFGHDNVRIQMLANQVEDEPPLITFSENMSFFINGEKVHVFKVPDSHTNGDVYIHFEKSNVVHTGDVYRTTTYPYIDVKNGGSFLGTIDALDLLISVCDENTRIIPGHGDLSNINEARQFRDMLATIRDRVAASIDEGKSLEEVQAAGLTAEYDERWAGTGRIGSADGLLAAAYADIEASR